MIHIQFKDCYREVIRIPSLLQDNEERNLTFLFFSHEEQVDLSRNGSSFFP
jgi:hypothetical protein